MLGYNDKRNFFRMMINSGCQIVVHDHESSRTLAAICKDISATGMSFEVEDESVEIGTMVDVFIESTNSQIPSLSAKAKVVRSERGADKSCTIGVEITEMN
ncbi:MAG: c-di-GMP-binding flagellar brake protein YcgR [Paraglaciecola sp.]|jgi:c-di-GMP-binding flagellar brake protein YcgR